MEKCEFFWWETSQGVKWPILKTLRFWYNGVKGLKSWTSKDILVMDYDWWHFFCTVEKASSSLCSKGISEGLDLFSHQLFMSILNLSLPSVLIQALSFFFIVAYFLTLVRGLSIGRTLSTRVTKFIIFKYYTSMLCLLNCFVKFYFGTYILINTMFFGHFFVQV